ncbi:DUF1810 family protein [Sorangium sp. So ce321]|uniref:DUF1810 family protein n=1 Tax=Sorangium sp. So ce321 TaxID=3133300 RepID=UPI003F61BCA0
MNQVEGRSPYDIFGSRDELKFCSSMTLFARAAPDEGAFLGGLEKYCDAEPDPRTLALLE